MPGTRRKADGGKGWGGDSGSQTMHLYLYLNVRISSYLSIDFSLKQGLFLVCRCGWTRLPLQCCALFSLLVVGVAAAAAVTAVAEPFLLTFHFALFCPTIGFAQFSTAGLGGFLGMTEGGREGGKVRLRKAHGHTERLGYILCGRVREIKPYSWPCRFLPTCAPSISSFILFPPSSLSPFTYPPPFLLYLEHVMV